MANETQIELWSGEIGNEWLHSEDRRMVSLAPFAELLLRVAQVSSGERVLDIGCGTGPTTFALGDAVGPTGRVIGVDVSGPLIEVARSRVDGREHVEFVVADAQVHPFEPVDVVASRFGVMFFDDPIAAFSNLTRALVSGGRTAFVCWQPPGPHNPMLLLPAWAVAGIVELPSPPPPDAPGPLAFADPSRVQAILEAGGLRDVSFEPFSAPMWMGPPDTVELAQGMVRISRLREVLATLDETTRQRAIAAIAEALEPFRRDDGIWLDGAVWAVTARKP